MRSLVFEHVSKRYRVPTDGVRHLMLASQLAHALRHGFRANTRELAAVDDVSFEVMTGEVFGIIGSNGAGKSTILKLIGRVTDPSEGRILVRGKVGMLLEAGTGFHPELTGRENVFLNGAILGLARADIRRRLDEIFDLAGVTGFVDLPVKRYSTGMQLRLAFAVAAQLEPEILLVDEVLSVGDAEFLKRANERIGELARDGGTVIFVSHNLEAVRSLCHRTMLLRDGASSFIGSTDEAISMHLGSST